MAPPGRKKEGCDIRQIQKTPVERSLWKSEARLGSFWRDSGRVDYTSVTDSAALDAFDMVAQHEGVLPALETSHALAWAVEAASKMRRDEILVVCMSGRGDKDAAEIARLRGHK